MQKKIDKLTIELQKQRRRTRKRRKIRKERGKGSQMTNLFWDWNDISLLKHVR